MRIAILTAVAAVIAGLTGCGADDPGRQAPPPARVSVTITAPADGATVRDATTEVQGRVSPGSAAVSVLGRPALVTGDRFTVVVPLEPGANVIDVIATAPRRSPALAALRLTRDVFVSVPQLADVPEDEVQERLDAFDLKADITRGGGLLEVLRSGERAVCTQRPAAGASVRRGATVRVVVAKRC